MPTFTKTETITCYDLDGNRLAKFNPGEPVTPQELFDGIPGCVVIRTHNRLGNLVQTIRTK